METQDNYVNTHTNNKSAHKRPRSESTTASSSKAALNTNADKIATESFANMPPPSSPVPTHKKKLLKNSSESVQVTKSTIKQSKQLEEFKLTIQANPDKYPLNLEQFDSFVDNCKGVHNIINTANQYTTDIPNLLQMIIDARASITSKGGYKIALTKLAKKLKAQARATNQYLSTRSESTESLETGDDDSELNSSSE